MDRFRCRTFPTTVVVSATVNLLWHFYTVMPSSVIRKVQMFFPTELG